MKLFAKLAIAVSAIVSLFSVAGVMATWAYADKTVDDEQVSLGVTVNGFVYTPPEMPPVEVTAVQRLSDILNGKYTTDKVTDSLDYLLNETIQVYWNNDPTQDPFVGSMDNTYRDEVEALFGDVLEKQDEKVAFILKNQDLNGDGHREIAMYSTSDPLDNTTSDYKGVVCVYVTVFTPIVDRLGNVTGYKQVCESLRGYCYEIYYSPSNHEPSFSTDEWRDSVAYTSWGKDTELPDDDKDDFDSYNLQYNPTWLSTNYTKPYGKTLSTVLKGQF